MSVARLAERISGERVGASSGMADRVGERKPSIFLAAGAEELLKHGAAFGFQHAGEDFRTVVEVRVVQDREDRMAAAFGIGYAPYDERYTGKHDRARAHGARLFGDIQDGFRQPPVAQRGRGLGQRDHFGVGGGIIQQFRLVMGAGKHLDGCERNAGGLRFLYDDTTGGDFLRFSGFCGFAYGKPHEIGVEFGSQHVLDCRPGGGGCKGVFSLLDEGRKKADNIQTKG